MIRNEREYQEAVKRLQEEAGRLNSHQAELEAAGLPPESVQRAMHPLRSFHLQLAEEVEYYERLRRGDLEALENLHGLGRLLVGLRIVAGMSQRELATRIAVDESQVSRDERNEYHGISIERAGRVLDALGVYLVSEVRRPPKREEVGGDLVTN